MGFFNEGNKMDIKNIWSNEKKIKIATGLTLMEAHELIQDFEIELNAKRLNKNGNSNNNDGRPRKLDIRGIFLMLMLFNRHYLTIELLALVFGLDASNVKRWIDDSQEALKVVLVKKNFSHLIAPNKRKKSRKPFRRAGSSMLMALNNLSEDQKIK
jgi:hypothetical protein